MTKVVAIYICKNMGLPMQQVPTVNALAGLGLEGDRYALGQGAYSKAAREAIRHVTLFGAEALEAANRELSASFAPHETRRNILTEGIELNNLIGREFLVGPVRMRGLELCDPCGRPSKLAAKEGFATAFLNRGGLRAEILSSGPISPGDPIAVL
ncbi:MAG: sulfurase [Candidatus Kerfeldbacteria bacterium]|nr:sulfurase [Candidatus Kerfeldbacteria bacterium]